MKFNDTLMLAVRRDLDNNLIPMLLGEPGIGKSSWTEALAELMHTKCFTLACNQLADKADLTGARLVPVQDKDGNTISYKQVFYPHAVISDAIAYAQENPRETPILFMDEMNRTTPDVTSECLSIPTMRSIGSVSLPSNLRVMLAGNDKGNVTSLDEASISRFALYHVTPDTDTFLGLNQNLNPFVKNVLTAHPECIFCKTTTMAAGSDDNDDNDVDIEEIIDDGEDMLQITTPRTISAVSKWLNSFSNQELMSLLAETRTVNGQEVSALQEILEGHIGNTVFCSFLLAEITSGIMTTNNQSTNLTVGKPACYDELKSCGSMSELSDYIDSMTDNDKSGCLLYSIYEKEDNANLIKALTPHINMLESGDMKTLIAIIAADALDAENVHTLLSTNTNIADRLSVILEA